MIEQVRADGDDLFAINIIRFQGGVLHLAAMNGGNQRHTCSTNSIVGYPAGCT